MSPRREGFEHPSADAISQAVAQRLKFGFLGSGTFRWEYLGLSFAFMLILLLVGTAIFNRTEKNFMDVV